MARSSAAVFIATGFGVGWFPKAPGTAGSLLGLLLWWPALFLSLPLYLVLVAVALVVGIKVSTQASLELGLADPPMVVWDEVVGMGVALLGASGGWWSLWAAFGLFRFFDIVKPYPIQRLERLPHGYGIMLDDVLAGVYAALCLEVVSWLLKNRLH